MQIVANSLIMMNMHLHFKLLTGEDLDKTVASNICTIGRSNKCDIVIPHEGMSRLHCQIEVSNGEIFITDLGSTNGVLIDGKRINAHERVPYATFLPLAFGAVKELQIELDEAPHHEASLSGQSPQHSGNFTSMTKTKTISQEVIRGTPKPKQGPAKDRPSGGLKSIMINVLALALLGGAIWWYLENGESTDSSQESTEENASP